MTASTDLEQAITAEHVALQSLFQYLLGLPALLAAAQGASDADLAAMQAQVDQDTKDITAALAAAPAEPAPAPEPAPTPAA